MIYYKYFIFIARCIIMFENYLKKMLSEKYEKNKIFILIIWVPILFLIHDSFKTYQNMYNSLILLYNMYYIFIIYTHLVKCNYSITNLNLIVKYYGLRLCK